MFKLMISLYTTIPKDSRTFPETCSYHLPATFNPYFLHRHQWTAFVTPSCLPLCSLGANTEHSQTMWLTDSSVLLHNLYFELTACLSIFAFIALVCSAGPGLLLTILLSPSWIPPSSTTSKRDYLSHLLSVWTYRLKLNCSMVTQSAALISSRPPSFLGKYILLVFAREFRAP